MAETHEPEALLRRYMIRDGAFVDVAILNALAGETIVQPKRTVSIYVKEIIAKTNLRLEDILFDTTVGAGKRKLITYVQTRIMQLIIVRGGTALPWTPARRAYVRHFFGDALIPDADTPAFPHASHDAHVSSLRTTQSVETQTDYQEFIPGSETTAIESTDIPSTSSTHVTPVPENTATEPPPKTIKRRRQNTETPTRFSYHDHTIRRIILRNRRTKETCDDWKTDNVTYWDKIFDFAIKNDISIESLVTSLLKRGTSYKKKGTNRSKTINYLKILIFGVLNQRGSTEEFRRALVIAWKTGNVPKIIAIIRSHLKIPGVRENPVPSFRSLYTCVSYLKHGFNMICEPERTFTGFRLNLVACVKAQAYIQLGKTQLQGVRVDIWGDGCRMLKKDVTRIVFRIIHSETPVTCQSPKATFCVASFYG
jgi:hypothetical protein